MRNLRNNKGFTLIELMIVVVIIGILAAIAIPKFSKLGDDAKTKEADTQLKQIATLQDAFRAQCGVYITVLYNTDTSPCTGLEDVGYTPPTLQFYQTPTVTVTAATATTPASFTVTSVPSTTTGKGLPTRKYDSTTGQITNL